MKTLLRFAALQFLVCTAFTYNFRAVARGDIANTVVSEIAYSLVNFVMVKKIAGSEQVVVGGGGICLGEYWW